MDRIYQLGYQVGSVSLVDSVYLVGSVLSVNFELD